MLPFERQRRVLEPATLHGHTAWFRIFYVQLQPERNETSNKDTKNQKDLKWFC